MKKQNKKSYKSGQISKYVEAICSSYKLDFDEVKTFLFVNFPELRDKTTCANCSASMKSFWHRITPGLVGVLIKAIEHVKKTQSNCFHYKDLNLNYSEASNLQKLRFHGLIAHVPSKAGFWLITSRGGQFLRGEMAIPVGVKTFRNHVEEHSEETIHISALKNKFPDFDSRFAYEIKPQIIINNVVTKQPTLI